MTALLVFGFLMTILLVFGHKQLGELLKGALMGVQLLSDSGQRTPEEHLQVAIARHRRRRNGLDDEDDRKYFEANWWAGALIALFFACLLLIFSFVIRLG